jgi:hypothetical protein
MRLKFGLSPQVKRTGGSDIRFKCREDYLATEKINFGQKEKN